MDGDMRERGKKGGWGVNTQKRRAAVLMEKFTAKLCGKAARRAGARAGKKAPCCKKVSWVYVCRRQVMLATVYMLIGYMFLPCAFLMFCEGYMFAAGKLSRQLG
ncbi:MAG: hypothetical protein IJM64_03110 [Ottowia sp.]|nr:hypothetical protein [Ottowia sp.]